MCLVPATRYARLFCKKMYHHSLSSFSKPNVLPTSRGMSVSRLSQNSSIPCPRYLAMIHWSLTQTAAITASRSLPAATEIHLCISQNPNLYFPKRCHRKGSLVGGRGRIPNKKELCSPASPPSTPTQASRCGQINCCQPSQDSRPVRAFTNTNTRKNSNTIE